MLEDLLRADLVNPESCYTMPMCQPQEPRACSRLLPLALDCYQVSCIFVKACKKHAHGCALKRRPARPPCRLHNRQMRFVGLTMMYRLYCTMCLSILLAALQLAHAGSDQSTGVHTDYFQAFMMPSWLHDSSILSLPCIVASYSVKQHVRCTVDDRQT